jgi:uncharacterized protein YxjI
MSRDIIVKCPQCGDPSPLSQGFCEQCGAALQNPQQYRAPVQGGNPNANYAPRMNPNAVVKCPQCGDPSPLSQGFCEQCGASLTPINSRPPAQAAGRPMPQQNTGVPPAQPQMQYMGLFDPRHMFYVLKEKFWGIGSGPIMNERGQVIGNMHRKIFSLRQKIEFREMNGYVSSAVDQKLVAIKPTYNLKDDKDVLIARFQKTILSVFRPKFYLLDPYKKKTHMAQGNFMGFDFKVFRLPDETNPIAVINKTDAFRDIIIRGAFNFSDTYALRILDPNSDRRKLLGLVVAIDNVLHDNRGSGGLLGKLF